MRLEDAALDPVIRAWVARGAEIARDLPDLAATDLPTRRVAGRRLSDGLACEFTLPAPPDVVIDNVTIEGEGGPIRVRRYRPADSEAPFPTQVFLHGGGFWTGTIDEALNDRLLAARCHATRVQILSVEYRLAPEHPFPAAVHDAIAAVDAASGLGADPERIGIGGNSAGAAIAASAALILRDRGDSPLMHQSLEVLPAALHPVGASFDDFGVGFGVDDIPELPALYIGTGTPPPYASPLDADTLAGLPSTHILVAEYDPLRDSGLAYAERLRRAGVATEVHDGRGHLHGSVGLTASLPIAREWQDALAEHMCDAYLTATLHR